MPNKSVVNKLFENSTTVSDLAQQLSSLTRLDQGGASYYQEIIGQVDCVRYTSKGIEFMEQGRQINPPLMGEVLILPTSVSLCGTDLSLIDKAQHGQLPAEAIGKVVGHEAAGLIVGVGQGVTHWQLGEYVCLDSHYACANPAHQTFNDCVESGQSCDGIVGGIRGASDNQNGKQPPIDGYWSRVIAVPAGAVAVRLETAVADQLTAPSTLESLGNIYMIVEQMKSVGLLKKPEKTAVIVSGLGATGYPMAAVATHYGCRVLGVNPSSGKRQVAQVAGVVGQAESELVALSGTLGEWLQSGEVTAVCVVVTAGEPAAHEAAFTFLSSLPDSAQKVLIMFGLYSDAQSPISFAPADQATVPQRDFVFSRQSFVRDGVAVYGVCGRNNAAWQQLVADLQLVAGQPPKLVAQLNQAQLQVTGTDPLAQLASELNQGAEHVKQQLAQNQKLKMVANFLS